MRCMYDASYCPTLRNLHILFIFRGNNALKYTTTISCLTDKGTVFRSHNTNEKPQPKVRSRTTKEKYKYSTFHWCELKQVGVVEQENFCWAQTQLRIILIGMNANLHLSSVLTTIQVTLLLLFTFDQYLTNNEIMKCHILSTTYRLLLEIG
jgi:hypothetical protein